MTKRFKKKTSPMTYLILFNFFIASLFIIYGFHKFLFTYETSFWVHFSFVASGSLFLFCVIVLILEMMEEEGIEYILSDKGIAMARIPFFYSCNIKWEDILSFTQYNIKKGGLDRNFYIIKDKKGNELSIGENIQDFPDFLKEIVEKTSLEPQETETSKEHSAPPFYYFKALNEKVKNSHNWRLKIYNISNVIIMAFFFILLLLIQFRSPARSDEINKILFSFNIILFILLIIPTINLIFYKLFLQNPVAQLSRILFLLINIVVICFFVLAIISSIYFFQSFAAQVFNFYPLLIILLMVFIFYPLGNIYAILWIRKVV